MHFCSVVVHRLILKTLQQVVTWHVSRYTILQDIIKFDEKGDYHLLLTFQKNVSNCLSLYNNHKTNIEVMCIINHQIKDSICNLCNTCIILNFLYSKLNFQFQKVCDSFKYDLFFKLLYICFLHVFLPIGKHFLQSTPYLLVLLIHLHINIRYIFYDKKRILLHTMKRL